MRSAFVILFCLVGLAFGQSYMPNGRKSFRSTTTIFDPTSIAGLAYAWNYNDLSKNGTLITNWTERIQAIAATNIAIQAGTTNDPTKGVYFQNANAKGLDVNGTINLPTNFSIWIGFFKAANSASYETLIGNAGTSGFYVKSGSANYYHSTADHLFGAIVTNAFTDILMVNATGQGYTNGVASSTIAGRTSAQPIANLGKDVGDIAFQSNIRFIYIWTNLLTSTDAANLHIWSLSN